MTGPDSYEAAAIDIKKSDQTTLVIGNWAAYLSEANWYSFRRDR
jgi:hypothetical protein